MHDFTFLYSDVAGPKFTKFTNSIARSSQMNFLKSENGNIAIRIRVPGRRIKVNRPILTPKLVAMETSLERDSFHGDNM